MSIKTYAIIAAMLGLTACQSTVETQQQDIDLQGSWHIEVINEKPVIDYSPAQLTFEQDGKLTGNNSCNNFFGQYSVDGAQITLNPAGSTMKACVDALMDQEQRVMMAMPEITSGELKKGKLLLKDAEGKTQLVLTKH
ncbi:META domain-containing protein [uncultured Shewanella sp.]|uniref:META domain-containing protein n=1 Tax=Shewanella atlantica TaxID=271099 RepID=UPI00263A3AE2|nr:META domain-containing protein [uncultured Shewanella sp.]